MSRNTRPARAGLKRLLPSPPKAILVMPIATNEPIMTIHIGRLEGRLNPSSSPVSMAEPSPMVGFSFSRNFCMRYSTTIHESIEVRVTIKAPTQKK